jgi:hypothetical protein
MTSEKRLDIDAFRAGKAEFDAAHRKGMDALKRRDFAGLEDAIKTERDIIDDQHAALNALKDVEGER